MIVNGFLITIYLMTSWSDSWFYYFWPIWPLAGWGVGLFFNFLAVFVFPDTPASRQKMIEKELGTMSNYTLPAQTPLEYPNYQYPAQPAPIYANKSVEAQVPPEKTPVS